MDPDGLAFTKLYPDPLFKFDQFQQKRQENVIKWSQKNRGESTDISAMVNAVQPLAKSAELPADQFAELRARPAHIEGDFSRR